MIPAITWAILATEGGIGIWVVMRRENRRLDRMGYGQYQRAEKLAGELATALKQRDEWSRAAIAESVRLIDAEGQLRAIKTKRHNAAVKARQAQLSQQRAKVLAKASELVPPDSAWQPEEQAA